MLIRFGLVPDHPDISVGLVLLLDAIGLKDPSLGKQLLSQMAAVADGHEDALNAMIAFVKGLQHGARGGAPKGEANGAWKHGLYSGAAKAERSLVKLLLKDASSLQKLFSKDKRDC